MIPREKYPLWLRIFLAFCWYGVIWCITELPISTTDSTGTFWEWIGLPALNGSFRVLSHMFVFGVQSLFIYFVFSPIFSFSKKWIFFTLLLVALLGIVDEVHQSFKPGRFPRALDVGKDVIGATLFLYVTVMSKKKGRSLLFR